MKKIIIAIDGFSSTGKSTLAKQVAAHLNYLYVDTGAMYRAITHYAMKNNYVSQTFLKEADLIAKLPEIVLTFQFNATLGYAEIYVNGVNVEKEIRNLAVSQNVSKIATLSEVRAKLVEQQQKMGVNKGIVMDGRDIGTVVFPTAELKIFMTASAQTRAQRRYDELLAKGEKVNFQEVLTNIQQRDYIDTNRKDSPLKQAPDAVLLDNSNLSREAQFDQVVLWAKNKLDSIE